MRSYSWNGHLIEVEFRPLGAFLWLAAGFEVRVGKRTFLPKPDGLALKTSTEFEIESDGTRTLGVVKSVAPIWFLPRVKYSLIIGDTLIARDILTLRRWYLAYFATFLVVMVLLFALLGLFIFVSVALSN
jgi:hypothetical protein